MSNSSTEGFVSPNGGRDTISIIHGCLSTILLCSWSSLHLNVPANEDSEWTVALRKAKWMLADIVAPEYVSFKAIRECYEACWLQKQIRLVMELREAKQSHRQVMESTLIDSNFPLSGCLFNGYAVHEDTCADADLETVIVEYPNVKDQSQSIEPLAKSTIMEVGDEKSDGATISGGMIFVSSADQDGSTSSGKGLQWTLEHSHFVYMGGVELIFEDNLTFRLNALQFLALLRADHIDLPELSAKDLRARSKSDVFAKSWACIQIVWFITYLATRASGHLPVTTLELFTAGQVCCTLSSYVGWWKKPKDISTPFRIPVKGKPTDVRRILETQVLNEGLDGLRIANNDNIDPCKTGMKLYFFFCSLPTLFFATCNLLPWNQRFNTTAEKLLWRTSSISGLVLPVLVVALADFTGRRKTRRFDCGITVLLFLYVVFRIYVTAEMFAGLRQVPSAVYEDNGWTRYLPHVGS